MKYQFLIQKYYVKSLSGIFLVRGDVSVHVLSSPWLYAKKSDTFDDKIGMKKMNQAIKTGDRNIEVTMEEKPNLEVKNKLFESQSERDFET